MRTTKVRSLHQLELSSHCNLRCPYCPSRHLGREKLYMSVAHFERAIDMVYQLHREGTQYELNLAGIGESTMHPRFRELVQYARERLGPRIDLVLATNGLKMTDELAVHLYANRVRTWVSLHRPEKAGPAIECLRRAGALAGVSSDPSLSAIDWAGQVELMGVPAPAGAPCQWTQGGRIMLMADGRFTRCCLDADGRGVLNHIELGLPPFTSAYVLCQKCQLDAGVGPEDMKTDTGVRETIVSFKNLHKTRKERIDVDA